MNFSNDKREDAPKHMRHLLLRDGGPNKRPDYLMNSQEDPNATGLKLWLSQNNGYFNPNAEFRKSIYRFCYHLLASHTSPAISGFSVVASETLPSDSKIISIPFSLAITKKSAAEALSQILGDSSTALESWNERQCIASYLSLSHLLNGER